MMKTGKCPKCGSATVHAMNGGLGFSNMDKIFVHAGKTRQPSSFTSYVCVTCGYFETYLTGSYLPEVAKTWTKVQVKG
jgi:hypothetical protein